jgi:hypothetical protein
MHESERSACGTEAQNLNDPPAVPDLENLNDPPAEKA